MRTYSIMLSSVNAVKTFVHLANTQDFDIDLVSGRYIIDAKSIMGIFSLDLSKPITIEVHAQDEECEEFVKLLAEFIV